MPRGNGTTAFSEIEKANILLLAEEGKRYTYIAEHLNRDVSAVRRYILKCKAPDGSFEQPLENEKRGRKRKSTPVTDRHIVLEVKRNRFVTANQLKQLVPPVQDLCINTIKSRIKESGEFESYWAQKKPFISPKNKVNRVRWAKEHLNWTREQWRTV
jgi:hypothetical protein